MNDSKHIVYLHGALGKTYGTDPITIWGTDIRDVTKGLCCMFGDKFKNTIRDGSWHITTGDRKSKLDLPDETDNFLDEKEVELKISAEEIHFFPAIQGAGGVLRIIVGVILIIIGVVLAFTPFSAAAPYLIAAGIGLVIGGIIQVLTKPPKMGQYENASVDQKPSFIFNGVVNTVEQGGPVPLVYGRHLTGSTVISAGMTIEQL